MAKFRKKPIVIDAVKWTGHNILEIEDFINQGKSRGNTFNPEQLIIHTLEGDHVASKGDWIIKGIHGEFYPCKSDIFEKTYDPVEG